MSQPQTTLTDGGWTEAMDFKTAINTLNDAANGYGDRIEIDAAIKRHLDSRDELDPSYYTERQSQDIVRYGINPDDVQTRWEETLNKQINDDTNVEHVLNELETAIIEFATQHHRD